MRIPGGTIVKGCTARPLQLGKVWPFPTQPHFLQIPEEFWGSG